LVLAAVFVLFEAPPAVLEALLDFFREAVDFLKDFDLRFFDGVGGIFFCVFFFYNEITFFL
jgi:hypothetical protein